MFYLDFAEDLSWGDNLHIALRDFSEEVREQQGYIGVLAKEKEKKRYSRQIRTSKILLTNQK